MEYILTAHIPTSIGIMTVARSKRGLCAVVLTDDEESGTSELETFFPKDILHEDEDALKEDLSRLKALIDNPSAHPERAFDLDIRGTPFQCAVWKKLMTIQPGSTMTYGEIAASISRPRAFRAVGRACGANRLALVIPCHRALAANGFLGGYRWGVDRKKALLVNEQQADYEEYAAMNA